jgi:hypothetical protein
MNVRRINSMLWLATLACVALAAASLAAGLLLPLEGGASESSGNRISKSQSHRSPTAVAALESFEQIASRKFRSPLADVAAAAAPAGVAAPGGQQGGAGPVLVGTIGDSLAMFRMPDGSIALKGVGDSLDGAEVVAIHPEQVETRANGRSVTFTKQKTADPAQGDSMP